MHERECATYRDTVPILVDHHHTQKDGQSEEKQPINIMLDGVAYCRAESEQEDLRDREEGSPEDDIADGPSVFQRAEDKDQLRNDVYDSAGQRPENVDDP